MTLYTYLHRLADWQMPGDGNLMFALGREREKAKFTSNVATKLINSYINKQV